MRSTDGVSRKVARMAASYMGGGPVIPLIKLIWSIVRNVKSDAAQAANFIPC